MIKLQEELSAVNDHITSGVAVSEEEWTSVRELIGTLGSTFHDDVDFAWEKSKKDANLKEEWEVGKRSGCRGGRYDAVVGTKLLRVLAKESIAGNAKSIYDLYRI
jgi:hypothetical protein